jgi:hypothetical protein
MWTVAPESRINGPKPAERLVGEACLGEDMRSAFEPTLLLFSRQSIDAEGSSASKARYSSFALYQSLGIGSVVRLVRATSGAAEVASRIASPVSESTMYAHPE